MNSPTLVPGQARALWVAPFSQLPRHCGEDLRFWGEAPGKAVLPGAAAEPYKASPPSSFLSTPSHPSQQGREPAFAPEDRDGDSGCTGAHSLE